MPWSRIFFLKRFRKTWWIALSWQIKIHWLLKTSGTYLIGVLCLTESFANILETTNRLMEETIHALKKHTTICKLLQIFHTFVPRASDQKLDLNSILSIWLDSANFFSITFWKDIHSLLDLFHCSFANTLCKIYPMKLPWQAYWYEKITSKCVL